MEWSPYYSARYLGKYQERLRKLKLVGIPNKLRHLHKLEKPNSQLRCLARLSQFIALDRLMPLSGSAYGAILVGSGQDSGARFP